MDGKIAAESQDSYDDQEKWVCDSSVDSKGQVPLRAKTGAWKASFFIIAIEFSERLSYYGIATNLVVYLTTILHQDLKMAVRSMNTWTGVTALMPLLGGLVADAYLGRYATVLVSTILYLMALMLLTLSWYIPGLKPCDSCSGENLKAHEIVFFLSIYLISIATGGHKPALESFGADQFDDGHPQERVEKMSYFNWWNSGLCAGILTSVTLLVYVEDRVGWDVAGIILISIMAFSLLIFLVGRPFYRYRAPTGSPLTPMLRVLVAAIAKRNLPHPSDPSQLHEVSKYTKGRLLCHTDNLKFLDKAAVIDDSNGVPMEKQSPWRLATVTRVEELKLIINMIPIWLSTLAFGICAVQNTTFFMKQSIVMDRHLGPNFVVPPASMFSLTAVTMVVVITLYDKALVPVLRRATGNPRGISVLQRVGTGMVFSVTTMVISALVEKKRLDHALQHKTPMSAMWLAPQFIVIGVADSFTLVGLQEFFYDEVPDSMRGLGIAFYLSVLGVASFANNIVITLVHRITEDMTGKSWLGKDLNSSRLDCFYWLLAAFIALNIAIFAALAQRYSYKSVQRQPNDAVQEP